MRKILLLLSSWVLLSSVVAQTSLSGKVTDLETGEPIIFGNVAIYKNGVLFTGRETDWDGNYSFSSIDPGTYDVEVSYLGYQTQRIEEVKVLAGKANKLDIKMDSRGIDLKEIVVVEYKVPLIEQDNATSGSVITSGQIRRMPKRNIKGLASSSAGLQSGKGENLKIRSSRSNITGYHIDGVQVNGKKKSKKQSNRKEGNIRTKENKFTSSKKEALSTFAIDVDNAAYSNVRQHILNNQMPPKDIIRTEEMINYFSYDYPAPTNKHPFEIYTELGQCPWNPEHWILHIGLQGKKIKLADAPANNLIFLIDVSGSMKGSRRLPLVKKSLKLLVNHLRPQDNIAIITYGDTPAEVLPFTSAANKDQIGNALDQLKTGGGTNGAAGLQMAYQLAKSNYQEDGNNRILIASDGDFNIGVFQNPELKALIEEKRKLQVDLTVLGFGMGNYQDSKLEILADNGNGNYAYIDNISEAKKVLVEEAGSTLFTIAKDVKVQLEFDPAVVASYRLIGYENRLMSKEDFENDLKDAGELGAGHSVTALYEIIPQKVNSENKLGHINLRYMFPKEEQSYFLRHEINGKGHSLDQTSKKFRFSAAVAGFSLLLRESKFSGNLDYPMVVDLAKQAKGKDKMGYRKEFLTLVKTIEGIEAVAGK